MRNSAKDVHTEKAVRHELWEGLIPCEFLLDKREVTSFQAPPPLYVMLPRMGYLPCFTQDVEIHFSEATVEVPGSVWFADAATGEPLPWHLPIGVLWDMHSCSVRGLSPGESAEDEEPLAMPWRIAVHFQGYPRDKLLPIGGAASSGSGARSTGGGSIAGGCSSADTGGGGDGAVVGTVRSHFVNALKQALYMQTGSGKTAMSMAMARQTQLWEGVRTNSQRLYDEVEAQCLAPAAAAPTRLVPVRAIVPGRRHFSQLPVPPAHADGTPLSLMECVARLCPWRERQHAGSKNAASSSQGDGGDGSGASSVGPRSSGGRVADLSKGSDGESAGGDVSGGSGDQVGCSSRVEGGGHEGLDDGSGGGVAASADVEGSGTGDASRNPFALLLATNDALQAAAAAVPQASPSAPPPPPLPPPPSALPRDAGLEPVPGTKVVAIAQGIPLRGEAPIAEVWAALRHPDRFLYLIVPA